MYSDHADNIKILGSIFYLLSTLVKRASSNRVHGYTFGHFRKQSYALQSPRECGCNKNLGMLYYLVLCIDRTKFSSLAPLQKGSFVLSLEFFSSVESA